MAFKEGKSRTQEIADVLNRVSRAKKKGGSSHGRKKRTGHKSGHNSAHPVKKKKR